ncbi:MAG TPA: Ig-like domain-containing protein [Candidatus Dormibacteraeota bacterium]|nr:Ig-like domain-containing protein [Candidatus Dormibacteraeota bacterium]
MLLPLTACGGDPPQIVDYAPQRNSVDVSTAGPIRITFDHDVDKASVESRLHLNPSTAGVVHWINGHELELDHATLRTSTTYEVVLEAGYRDPAGNTYNLRHHWSFTTEGSPVVTGSTPGAGDSGVDPSSYLSLDFTRTMDASSLKSAIALSPTIPIDIRLDPTDGRRAIIAPQQLLSPNTDYQLVINTAAIDIDGNQLGRVEVVRFTTGPLRQLHSWIAFATDGMDGSARGLWMVNDRGFPRQLFDAGAVRSFSWSPSGDTLIIEGQDESWWSYAPGGGTATLGFKAPWAAALAPGMGFVYISDGGALHRQTADGADEVIETDVAEASVGPTGLRIAYTHAASRTNEIWGYDVGLRAKYLLATDTGPVGAVAWAPSGNRIAYLRRDATASSLRMRSLGAAASSTTLTSGDLGAPAWLPDSTHIVFSAVVTSPGGGLHKAFVINVVSPPAALTLASGLPSDPGIEVTSPVPSPDGHQIAFLSGDQVWLMNADGTRPTPLTKQDATSFPYSCRALAWTRS